MPGGRLIARLAAGVALPLLAVGAACSDSAERVSPRATRYGIFEDLVLYRRAVAEGGPFFLDQFETTRQDWWFYFEQTAAVEWRPSWGAAPPPAGTEYLPVVRVSLPEARRFAEWRFCRLPRRDEWAYAATGRGGYTYPWGNVFAPAWVNDAELGLGSPTPVGTFESGRDDEGAYDLLGNVAEWTESVDLRWFSSEALADSPAHDLNWEALDMLDRSAALRPWRVDSLPWPGEWWVLACGPHLPRLVVGGHYLSRLQTETVEPGAQRLDGLGWIWERAPNERGDTVGIRLGTDPAALIDALLRERSRPTSLESARLRAFLRRPGYRAVLWPQLRARLPWAGPKPPLLRLLREGLSP